MDSAPNSNFEVPISGAIRELLIRIHDQAANEGQRDEFLVALRSISSRLRTDPVTFGEEVFDLKSLHLTIKVAVILPLTVEFGVYLDRRLVFIRSFRYIPPA